MLTVGFFLMKPPSRLLKEARQSRAAIILSISLGLMAGILGIIQAREVSKLISQVFLLDKDLASVSGILLTVLILVVIRATFV